MNVNIEFLKERSEMMQFLSRKFRSAKCSRKRFNEISIDAAKLYQRMIRASKIDISLRENIACFLYECEATMFMVGLELTDFRCEIEEVLLELRDARNVFLLVIDGQIDESSLL